MHGRDFSHNYDWIFYFKSFAQKKYRRTIQKILNFCTPDFMKNKKISQTIRDIFYDALGVILLRKNIIETVAYREKEGFGKSIFLLISGVFAGSCGRLIFTSRETVYSVIAETGLTLFMMCTAFVISQLAAKKFFRAEGKFFHYFRAVSYGSVIHYLSFFTFLPVLGLFALLWFLIINLRILVVIRKLDFFPAFLVLFLMIGIFMLMVSFCISIGWTSELGIGILSYE